MKSNKKYTIAIASLAFAMLGLLIPSNAFAASWEDATHVIYGDELKTIGDLDTNAVIHFTGNPDGLKGFELYDKSKAPHTANCQSGWNADEYSVCIFETKNMALGYHEWFDRTTDTWGKFYIYQADVVETTSTSNYQEVSDAAKNFKAQIEAKLNSKLAPLNAEIDDLKSKLTNSEEREKRWQSQIAELKTERTSLQTKLQIAQDDAVQAQESIDELSTANATIEQYKKDAENWRAICLEQLKVMAEVLGLF